MRTRSVWGGLRGLAVTDLERLEKLEHDVKRLQYWVLVHAPFLPTYADEETVAKVLVDEPTKWIHEDYQGE